MLRGQPPAKHVVGVGHHLDTDTVQICVQIPGGKKDALPRLQTDAVEQQRGQHTGITGVALAEFQHRLDLGGEFLCPGADVVDRAIQHRRHQHIEVGLRRGDPGGEQSPQTVGVGLIREQVDERVEVRDRQCTHQLDRAGYRAKSGQGIELSQRHQQFGLVAAVTVIADG